jgi:hypothetical protein
MKKSKKKKQYSCVLYTIVRTLQKQIIYCRDEENAEESSM